MARRLVERGARVNRLWHASALGLLARLEELLAADPPPSAEEIDNAFWQACHGGSAAGPDTRRELLVAWLRERGR